ncbi:MAG: GDP-mannose 4,6-dehydratase, partial [Candidatus Eisenbacteria bacterium]
MKNRVLITGALGFVGRHLYGELESSGHETWGSDMPQVCRQSEPPFDSRRLRPCDVTNIDAVAGVLNDVKPDSVVHLAAQSSAFKALSEPRETFTTNSLGTLNLFEAVRKLRPDCRVLVVGSADIYGPQARSGLLTEEAQIVPVSPYALSKAVQDLMCVQYCRSHAANAVRTRSFNHTGPFQTTTFVLPSFASQIARAEAGLCEPVIEVGNLEVVRDFSDVRDVVAAYRLILERGKAGEAYNVCSGKGRELRELLEILTSLSRVRISVKRSETRMRPVDIPYLVGDNSKLRSHTGWEPRYEIEKTLAELLE